jgi:hypothetical protein
MVEAHIAPLAPTAAPVVALSKMKPPELAKAINEKVAQMATEASPCTKIVRSNLSHLAIP